ILSPLDPASPHCSEEPPPDAKDDLAPDTLPITKLEPVGSAAEQEPPAKPAELLPDARPPGSPKAREGGELKEEAMETGTEAAASPTSSTGERPQPLGLRGGFSPQLSEEEGLEEGRAPGDPESSETPVSFTSEPKDSPLHLEGEELGRAATPMEVYGAANPSGGGAEGEEEAGRAPPTLRPRPLIKSDIVNEISNLSQGDTSASSFPGCEQLLLGSPDPEGGGSLSTDLGGLTSADASLHKDDGGLMAQGGAETDDSLLYDSKSEGEKGRRRSSPARSRVKQVASFPGRRRPRGGSHGGRGRGRSRLKSTTSSIETLTSTITTHGSSVEGQNFWGWVTICALGSRIFPSPQITKVMLLKGWRCVECIVCEVCGKASDPSRLLLCDDCDISYHTYCLEPPLNTVPKGGWKCKW
uniref:PHD-type domain-containing protein n=1 Tax=Sphenodon punctatus TaxID=8508 RepID=A0A8D0LAK4_SPHPU